MGIADGAYSRSHPAGYQVEPQDLVYVSKSRTEYVPRIEELVEDCILFIRPSADRIMVSECRAPLSVAKAPDQ